MSSRPPLRTNVYIDGFNLYYGCFQNPCRAAWKGFKWLDLYAFCRTVFPSNQINRIRYFTALVNPPPHNPDQRTRQLTYIRALETIPCLSVHLGRYATNRKRRYLADPSSKHPVPLFPLQTVEIIQEEEKGSDVNLASYLLADGATGDYDVAIVVSNDSDLAEPIRMVKSHFGYQVGILNPRGKTATDLLGIADFYRSVRMGHLGASQFPPTLTDATGI